MNEMLQNTFKYQQCSIKNSIFRISKNTHKKLIKMQNRENVKTPIIITR